MDRIKPIKFETPVDGTEDDEGYQTEADPSEDYIAAKGISFENRTDIYIDRNSTDGQIRFVDPVNGNILLSDLIGGTGGLSASSHRTLDQLVHSISETSYYEVTRTNNRVTAEIWWETDAKLKKIREALYTYDSGFVSTIVYKQYDASGTLAETYTETYSRTGGMVTSVAGVLS
jgi:hypothetical protein